VNLYHSPAREQPRRSGTQIDAEPISGYVLLASLFVGITSSALVLLRRNRLMLRAPGLLDATLIGLGTARLSRLITRDKVMRPLRAPFTVAEREPAGDVKEQPKGSGLVHAAGELVTCPRCTAIWAASCLSLTYYASPSIGRFAALTLSSALVSDFANRTFALFNEHHDTTRQHS